MDEELLHFVWIQQAYNHGNLATENGQKLSIVKPGYLNTNAGPDFFDASVLIDELKWVGHIEIHIKASDWFLCLNIAVWNFRSCDFIPK